MPDIDLLRRSFDSVEAESDRFATRFYEHLFGIAPELGALFENVDMASQGAMVVQAVRIALGGLDDFEALRPTLASLGYRHTNYGVTPEQYRIAAEAFVRSLRDVLGDDMDDTLENDWRDLLTTLTSAMTEGSDQVAGDRASRKEQFQQEARKETAFDAYTARFMPAEADDHRELYADTESGELPRSIPIEYVGEKIAAAAPLQTILDVSLQNDIPHTCVCGAVGKCSTCRVAVLEGLDKLLPRNQAEQEMANLKGFPPELRLACQTRVVGPVRLKRLVHDQADISEAASFGRDQVGREMDLAVLFADIRGFTPFTESHLAYDVVHALNRYFDAVGGAIDRHEGFIDKYLGDGVMALFGLDAKRNTHPCVDAVNAALEAQAELAKVNDYLRDHLEHNFQIVVGIHFGCTIVGEVGFSQRRQFTAIGDVVNTAARLESEAKAHDVGILVSDTVRSHLPEHLCAYGRNFDLALKGKSETKTAYEVLPR